ncbi:MAG: replicative DNA helicase [Ignavibacteriaceae bacterium]
MAKKTEENVNLMKLMPASLKPPSAPDVEMSVLGAMLIDRECVSKVIELLTETDFYLKEHRIIFKTMTDLFQANEPIDTVTLYQELSKQGKIDAAGGPVYISRLSQNISTSANVEYHAKILVEKSVLNKLISTSNEIARSAFAGTEDAFDLLDKAENQIFQIMESHLKRSYADMKRAVTEALEYFDAMQVQEYKNFAVPTGFLDLDDKLGGFQKKDLIILAARPSMGKTALGLSFARNAAVLYKIPVAVFSLEMATIQLIFRLISAEGRFNAQSLRTGKLPKAEGQKLWKVASKLVEAPIYIDDAPAQTILEIRAKARRLKAERNIGLVIIDYLQLMQGPPKSESREREISAISRSLKALAKELDVPVIAMAQLNRAVEGRTDKRPQLSDLRESGSIEQDADVVMFINRPEYYNIMKDSDGNSTEGLAEIIIAKHRNGPTGEAKLTFIKEHSRFENREMFRTADLAPSIQIADEDII